MAKKKIVEKKLDKRVFDEHWINGKWMYRVKQSFNSDSTYDIYWLFDGELYGWKQPIADPTFAVTLAGQYLKYRYNFKNLYILEKAS